FIMSESVPVLTDTPHPAAARRNARAAWADRLARFAESGHRPAQFCAQEGVSLPSFYAWKRRLPANASSAPRDANPDAPREPRWLGEERGGRKGVGNSLLLAAMCGLC